MPLSHQEQPQLQIYKKYTSSIKRKIHVHEFSVIHKSMLVFNRRVKVRLNQFMKLNQSFTKVEMFQIIMI